VIDQQGSTRLFHLATTPARWLSHFRTDLRVSLAEDAATFSGTAARAFAVFILIALACPILVSAVHASIGMGALPRMEPINHAVLPYYEDVYAESLPFMIAVAGIGAFSPALGVLLIAVFIPADLFAASKDTTSLQSLQSWGAFPAAPLARFISYGLLWILAVEIPLFARRWATGWAHRDGHLPSAAIRVGAVLAGTAALVFLWARALPWLIQPVFTWTPRQFTDAASNATWTFWPLLVIGATIFAGVAAAWPRPLRIPPEQAAAMGPPPGAPRSPLQTAVRQTISVLVLAALSAGLLTNALEAAILIGGLMIAGPVLTVVLPRLPVPLALATASPTVHWVAGLTVGVALGGAILGLVPVPEDLQNTLTVMALSIGAVAFRVVADAGARDRPSIDKRAVQDVAPASIITAAIVVVMGLAWLLTPAVALANNCPSIDDGQACPKSAVDSGLGFLLGALGAFGFAMKKPGAGAPPSKPFDPPQRDPYTGAPTKSPKGPPLRDADKPPKGKDKPPPTKDPGFLDDPRGWFNKHFGG
jgi:hypothetical protein